jgi:ribosomal protein L16 Arg81 hydroxylase
MLGHTMNLQSLLGTVPVSHFVAEYYQRLPYSGTVGADHRRDWPDWEGLLEIVTDKRADVLVCRRNLRLDERPQDATDVRRLLQTGATILVRHAERQQPQLAAVAAAFAEDFAAPVDLHVYCTPADQFGFGWHYDAEEVFIVQTQGRKRYSLRKNTVNPWPVEEALPANMHYEREIMPLWRCELSAGDWLYIPSGYWHKAEASELAISLAIGVAPRTTLDLMDVLRRELRESLFGRQRLPVCGTAASLSDGDLIDAYAELIQSIGAQIGRPEESRSLAGRAVSELRNGQSAPSGEQT